jgi:hypothetical protein
MDFYNFYIQQLPIPNISLNQQKVFIELVDKILLNHNANTSKWEKEIDIRIYRLFQLTYEEVKITNKNFVKEQKKFSNNYIKNLEKDIENTEEQIEEELRKNFKMKGLILADVKVIKMHDKKG